MNIFAVFPIGLCLFIHMSSGFADKSLTEKWESNPMLVGIVESDMQRLRNLHQDVLEYGCNLNLCFILEGTNSVNQKDFSNQKNFADLIVAITTTDRPNAKFCGAVYNRYVYPITRLTNDREQFLRKLHAAKNRKRGRYQANLNKGLNFSVRQLHGQRGDANKIILFSKKRPNVQGNLNFKVRRFFSRGGGICAVSLNGRYSNLLRKVTKDNGKIFAIDDFFDLSEIVVATVTDVCNMPCKEKEPGSHSVRRGSRVPRECPKPSSSEMEKNTEVSLESTETSA